MYRVYESKSRPLVSSFFILVPELCERKMNRRSSRSHGFKRWRTNRNNGIQIVDAKDEKIMVSAPTRSDDVSVFFF